jgi:hypothetical protein
MKVNLIDINRYKKLDSVLDFIDSFKNFDIDEAIEFLENQNIKDTNTVDEEYWRHLYNSGAGAFYNSNWSMGEDDLKALKDFKCKGSWKYIKFSDPSGSVPIPDFITEYFQDHLSKLNPPLQAEFHCIVDGYRIQDHIDSPDVIPINAAETRNLLVSLTYPKDVPPDVAGMHINNVAFRPEDTPMVLFDSQYKHGAWNHSDTPWLMLLIYVPAEDIEGETNNQDFYLNGST